LLLDHSEESELVLFATRVAENEPAGLNVILEALRLADVPQIFRGIQALRLALVAADRPLHHRSHSRQGSCTILAGRFPHPFIVRAFLAASRTKGQSPKSKPLDLQGD
jgi:hypothetical protein